VEEVVAYWPALVDRNEIEPQVRVEILEAAKRGSGDAGKVLA
jgi:hypothetical protein